MEIKKLHTILTTLLLLSFQKNIPCCVCKTLNTLNTKKEENFNTINYRVRFRQKKIGAHHIQIFDKNSGRRVNKKTIHVKRKKNIKIATMFNTVLKTATFLEVAYGKTEKELFDIPTGNPVRIRQDGAYFIIKHPKKIEVLHADSGRKIGIKENGYSKCTICKNVFIVEQTRKSIPVAAAYGAVITVELNPIITVYSIHTGEKIVSLYAAYKKVKNYNVLPDGKLRITYANRKTELCNLSQ